MGKKRNILITEEQYRELKNIMSESLIVNSSQVIDIATFLNNHFKVSSTYGGDISINGLPCTTQQISYVVNGQPLQYVKEDELIDILDDKYQHFVKDGRMRRLYLKQIVKDWLSNKIKSTGQLSVNYIVDEKKDSK